MKKWALLIVTLLTLLAFLPTNIPTVMAEESEEIQNAELNNGGWVFRRSWGNSPVDFINGINNFTLSKDGYLYVIPDDFDVVVKINLRNNNYTTLGEHGQLWAPSDIAIGPDGSIYITQFTGNRVARFMPDGTLIQQWGVEGTADGEFNLPDTVTVDRKGMVYVGDRSGRVQVFSSDGRFIRKFGSPGTGPGQFNSVYSIGVDDNEITYVLTEGTRIQRFDKNGNYLSEWEIPFSNSIYTFCPNFVFDSSENLVLGPDLRVFSKDGVFLGNYFDGAEEFRLLYIDSNGNVYGATNVGETYLAKYNRTGKMVYRWGARIKDPGTLTAPSSVEVTVDQNIIVAETGINNRMQVFNRDGVKKHSTDTDALGYLSRIAVETSGSIYALSSNDKINVFDKNYVHQRTIDLPDDYYYADIEVDNDGNIYLLVPLNEKIIKTDNDGNVIETWNYVVASTSSGISIHNDRLYLGGNDKILEYDLHGNLIKSFGEGILWYPRFFTFDE